MSIAFDPNSTTDICLPDDDEQPADKRRTFIARFTTCRERQRVIQLSDEAFKIYNDGVLEDEPRAAELAGKALAMHLADWRNVVDREGKPVAYAPENFPEVLTTWEILTLVWRAIRATRIAEVSRPFILSQRESKPGPSAETAGSSASISPAPAKS